MKKSLLIISAVVALTAVTGFAYVNWDKSDKASQCVSETSEAKCQPVCKAKSDKACQSVSETSKAKCQTASEAKADFTALAVSSNELLDLEKYKPVELFYDLGCQHGTGVTKEQLRRAKSVGDILPAKADWSVYDINTITASVFPDGNELSESRNAVDLNNAQLELLRTVDYSESFHLNAQVKGKNHDVPSEDFEMNYWITVVPEKQAVYSEGKEALIDYIRKNSKKETANVVLDDMGWGGVKFFVTKTGTVEHAYVSSTSKYQALDAKMIELINDLPGTWTPATDLKGEPVDQEFVFSFNGGGC